MAHGDKRSVSTDALETLGTIIGNGAGRDAIHIAVEPVIAACPLKPGQDVGLVGHDKAGVVPRNRKSVGIVDPFLKRDVKTGERFWLLVYPRQIKSLRHVWTHPDFPEAAMPVDTSDSNAFIADVADKVGISVEDFMASVNYYVERREAGSMESSICFPDDINSYEMPEGFWPHYEAVSGHMVPPEWREVYFRCAC